MVSSVVPKYGVNAMGEDKLKYLEFIQGNIDRMSRASFSYKAWAVTALTALFAAAIATEKDLLILLAALPIIIFWFLDGYHLEVERRYIKLYEAAIEQDVPSFDLRPRPLKNSKLEILSTIFSPTLNFLYVPLLFFVVASYGISTCSC